MDRRTTRLVFTAFCVIGSIVWYAIDEARRGPEQRATEEKMIRQARDLGLDIADSAAAGLSDH